jgi:hypothetical protein
MLKEGKYSYVIIGATLVIGVIVYIFVSGSSPHINTVFEMANGQVCCTVAIYQKSHKSGPDHYSIEVKSSFIGTDKSGCNQNISREIPCSMENYLGYANGFVWFSLREKPLLVYVFKQDSILDEKQSVELLNMLNPGTKLASIGYAPTASVVYARLTNGDEMIIDPKTMRYVSPTTETESYRYGLSGKTSMSRDHFDLNDSQQVVLKNGSPFNVGFDLIKETYAVKNGFFDSLRTSEALVFTKFIHPYFAILKGNVLLIQHRDIPGQESKAMISAFDLRSNQMLWTSSMALFYDSPTAPFLFDSLNPNYFYALNNNKLYKINIKTGKLVS